MLASRFFFWTPNENGKTGNSLGVQKTKTESCRPLIGGFLADNNVTAERGAAQRIFVFWTPNGNGGNGNFLSFPTQTGFFFWNATSFFCLGRPLYKCIYRLLEGALATKPDPCSTPRKITRILILRVCMDFIVFARPLGQFCKCPFSNARTTAQLVA